MSEEQDSVKAEAIRKRLKPLLDEVAEIISEAAKSGLTVSFNIATDQRGQSFVQPVSIAKSL